MSKPKRSTSKYYTLETLKYEWRQSSDSKGKGKAAGIDDVWPKAFSEKLDEELKRIRDEITTNNFGFRKLKVFEIEKENGKKRIICIPTVRDRLVQRLVIRNLTKDVRKKHLQKKLDIKDNPISYGLGLKNKTGVSDAIDAAIALRNENPWVLKTDISSFFDKIDRKYLIKEVEKRFQNSSLTALIIKAIECEADDSDPSTKKLLEENHIVRGVGLRQGMPLSPVLASFFLRKFDKAAYEKIQDNIIRYADDIIAFAKTEEECIQYEVFIRGELKNLKLEIPSLGNANESKTNIVPPNDPVDFLGIEIHLDGKKYGKKIRKKAIERILASFTEEATYEYAIKNNLTYSKLIGRLSDKIFSYKIYYKGTANIDLLLGRLAAIMQAAQNKILEDIFGADILKKLKQPQLDFLGLKFNSTRED